MPEESIIFLTRTLLTGKLVSVQAKDAPGFETCRESKKEYRWPHYMVNQLLLKCIENCTFMILTSDKPVLCTENLVAQRCQGYVVLLLLLQCNIASEGEWGVDCSQTSVSSQLTLTLTLTLHCSL